MWGEGRKYETNMNVFLVYSQKNRVRIAHELIQKIIWKRLWTDNCDFRCL